MDINIDVEFTLVFIWPLNIPAPIMVASEISLPTGHQHRTLRALRVLVLYA